jgi:hypothetical protein
MVKVIGLVKNQLTALNSAFGEKLSKIEAALQSIVRPTVSLSPCLRGRKAFEDFEENHLLKVCDPSDSDPVFNEDEFREMQDFKSEKVLVDKICERIQLLLPTRQVFSSEVNPWLVTYSKSPSFNQKPDICISNPAFLEVKGHSGALPTGFPADPSIYMGVNLIHVKISKRDENQALGEALVHAEYLEKNYVRHNNTAFIFHHAVAYKEEIFLFKYRGGILEAVRVPWNAGGSAAKLIDHFRERDPISRVLRCVLDTKKMRLHYDPCAFLGAGATGIVFRVREIDSAKEFALKLVIGENNVELLKREHARNQQISAECVVKACDLVLCDGIRGAGMLMEEVGTKVARETGKKNLNKTLAAMVRLHSIGYVHGDARVANLLNCQGFYKWCDVERSYQATDLSRLSGFREDIMTLLQSLNCKGGGLNMDLLKKYALSPSFSNIFELYRSY